MGAKMLSNKYVYPTNKLDYSRSIFNYKKTHSTNILTGYIYPVNVIRANPGDTLPNKFGFVLQSANLIGPSLDSIYIDVICVWVPDRLVAHNFNEWLGDKDNKAWTLNNNIVQAFIPDVYTYYPYISSTGTYDLYARSKSYLAEHYLAPHIGFRAYNTLKLSSSDYPSESVFHNGFNVMIPRKYDLIWNELFRNENIQDPILISKTLPQAGSPDSTDISLYRNSLGKLHLANRLKNVFNMAWLSPGIQTVDLGLGQDLPVMTGNWHDVDNVGLGWKAANTNLAPTSGVHSIGIYSDGTGDTTLTYGSVTGGSGEQVVPANLWADLSSLTVNSLYYSIMFQKYLNRASSGRRPVEYYKNFWGIQSSDAAHDIPELVSQKRYQVNISRVVATGNSEDVEGETQGLGTQGAFSITSVGGILFPEFTATEYGHMFTLAVIRTQESIGSGIDKELADYDLLGTYLPVFDHIGYETIEFANISGSDPTSLTNNNFIFGYQEAWWRYRMTMNTCCGLLTPGENMDYMTLARDFEFDTPFTVNTDYIAQSPREFDRMLQLKVCYKEPNEVWTETITVDGEEVIVAHKADEFGEPYTSDRYQWLIQFAVAGDFARTMSKNSEPLFFGGM